MVRGELTRDGVVDDCNAVLVTCNMKKNTIQLLIKVLHRHVYGI